MSMKLMVTAMNCKVGNPIRKLVLLKLADNANDDGECWPSYKYIAEQCEVSRSSVKEHIRQLEESGFLYREFRKDGKLNKSNIFHLTLGQHVSEVGQDITHPQAPDNLGSGSPAAPRISHSSEPINEPEETEADRVALYLHKKILSQNPDNKSKPSGWVKDIDRAIRIDERTEAQLICIIDWMYTGDMFWASVVQSGKKLREKYDTMIAQKRHRETAHETHQQGNQLRGAAAQSASFHETLKRFANQSDGNDIQQDAGDIYPPVDKRVSYY